MYSGSTLTTYSGRILGAHQKIDRAARRRLTEILPADHFFPSIKHILHFEGGNGPDALKRKSPAQDEPWHYFNPFDDSDTQLLDLIEDNYHQLIKALKAGNHERASFEAAWLAHALVDGLTPAHHYPYEEKLSELRGGQSLASRNTVKDKLVLPGTTRRQQFKNNWKMWGPKGLFTTHGAFELGIATMILPMHFRRVLPSQKELAIAQQLGVSGWFHRVAKEIASLGLYERFYEDGWTPKLARLVKRQLAPAIVKTVTVVWYCAVMESSGKHQ